MPIRPATKVLVVLGADGRTSAAAWRFAQGTCDSRDILVVYRGHASVVRMARAAGAVVRARTGEEWRWAALCEIVVIADVDDDGCAMAALGARRRVVSFVAADWAGWGATEDAFPAPARPSTRSAFEIAAAALLRASRYHDPYDGGEIECEAALDIAECWMARGGLPRGRVVATGMAWWKRRNVRSLLAGWDAVDDVVFVDSGRAALMVTGTGDTVVSWASRTSVGFLEDMRTRDVPVLLAEDGFLRSGGLGCAWTPPCSVTLDASGIHYDPSRPSDLEILLATTCFDEAMLERAARLIDLIVRRGIGKYGARIGDPRPVSAGRGSSKRILVPGQVADDRSVLIGGCGMDSGVGLLSSVRASNPEAWIVYRPHPDVEAGLRRGLVPVADIRALANEIADASPIAEALMGIDEVHVLTSQVGFDALLRRIPVTTYGQPFYAGWGLTRDVNPVARRTRTLTLEQLVAGALLMYPRYLDPVTSLPCPPEVLIRRLADPTLWQPGVVSRLRTVQGRLVRLLASAGSALPSLQAGARTK